MRTLALILIMAGLAGCASSSAPTDPPVDVQNPDEWPDRSIEFAASGGPGTGFLIFMEFVDPRDGEHEWTIETMMRSLHEDGTTVWVWDFGIVTSAHAHPSSMSRPGDVEEWESWQGATRLTTGTGSATVGGSELLGLVYGFASPAAWDIALNVTYEDGFAALHHWPITGLEFHEEGFGGSVGYSEGSAAFGLEGTGWTLAVLHRVETYPQRAYQTSITFPSGYSCQDIGADSSIRIPPGDIDVSDWFAHFADSPGTLTFEATDAGLDALKALQVVRLRFDGGLPDALPFPDHAEGFVGLHARLMGCPE